MEDNKKEFEEENLEMIQQHKKTNKHRKNGFTLVEILAVIIILGILMIIAIPAVTKNISESKSTTYITTVNKMMDTAMADVSAGDYSVGNKDITYYIPTSCLDIENKRNESPYGKFVKSYVVVTYNGEKNDYYFTGIDETGHGILLTYRDKLSEDSIKTDLIENDINTLIGVGERNQIVVYSDSCDKTRTKDNAITSIPEHGEL